MLRPAYPIRTTRLLLRPFASDDVADVWAYQRQPAVARYLAWEARDRGQSEAAVHQMVQENALVKEGDCLSLAMVWPHEWRAQSEAPTATSGGAQA